MILIDTSKIQLADDFRVYEGLTREARRATVDNVTQMLRFTVRNPLINRARILNTILEANKERLDYIRDDEVLDDLFGFYPDDVESKNLLQRFGFVSDQEVTSVIFKLSKMDEISKDSVESVRAVDAIKTILINRKRRMYTPEEAMELLASDFVDFTGQKNLVLEFDKMIPWNVSAGEHAIACYRGKTPFLRTLEENPELACWLLETREIPKFDFKVVDEDGRTVLHTAVCSGNLRLFRLLLEVKNPGMDFAVWVNRKHKFPKRNPVLFTAARAKQCDKFLKPLIGKGANIFALNKRGQSVLHYIYDCGVRDGAVPLERIGELVACGIPVDIRDKKGRTLLLYAAAQKDLLTVKFLIENGADPRVTDYTLKKKGLRDIIMETRDKQYIGTASIELSPYLSKGLPC